MDDNVFVSCRHCHEAYSAEEAFDFDHRGWCVNCQLDEELMEYEDSKIGFADDEFWSILPEDTV